ncbi:uncharacterized protein CMU_012290 [Cryptosporidium muris RN66]|uniref:Uncharacterized protein n=1 Tax=Cryptosporidium muris (strain RN66) TaxID=441375 RepID=B6AED8_CRYMR|nr:uncharacterized protein CMU_012290 [Cryptosporidium muris RN66]EEA06555.1 hypothetical protein, conserved [Cryptosporidium muris RN66]|eukprot:XP_002140904.1 hypothetical protein [Cryptosporidium muris RN66]
MYKEYNNDKDYINNNDCYSLDSSSITDNSNISDSEKYKELYNENLNIEDILNNLSHLSSGISSNSSSDSDSNYLLTNEINKVELKSENLHHKDGIIDKDEFGNNNDSEKLNIQDNIDIYDYYKNCFQYIEDTSINEHYNIYNIIDTDIYKKSILNECLWIDPYLHEESEDIPIIVDKNKNNDITNLNDITRDLNIPQPINSNRNIFKEEIYNINWREEISNLGFPTSLKQHSTGLMFIGTSRCNCIIFLQKFSYNLIVLHPPNLLTAKVSSLSLKYNNEDLYICIACSDGSIIFWYCNIILIMDIIENLPKNNSSIELINDKIYNKHKYNILDIVPGMIDIKYNRHFSFLCILLKHHKSNIITHKFLTNEDKSEIKLTIISCDIDGNIYLTSIIPNDMNNFNKIESNNIEIYPWKILKKLFLYKSNIGLIHSIKGLPPAPLLRINRKLKDLDDKNSDLTNSGGTLTRRLVQEIDMNQLYLINGYRSCIIISLYPKPDLCKVINPLEDLDSLGILIEEDKFGPINGNWLRPITLTSTKYKYNHLSLVISVGYYICLYNLSIDGIENNTINSKLTINATLSCTWKLNGIINSFKVIADCILFILISSKGIFCYQIMESQFNYSSKLINNKLIYIESQEKKYSIIKPEKFVQNKLLICIYSYYNKRVFYTVTQSISINDQEIVSLYNESFCKFLDKNKITNFSLLLNDNIICFKMLFQSWIPRLEYEYFECIKLFNNEKSEELNNISNKTNINIEINKERSYCDVNIIYSWTRLCSTFVGLYEDRLVPLLTWSTFQKHMIHIILKNILNSFIEQIMNISIKEPNLTNYYISEAMKLIFDICIRLNLWQYLLSDIIPVIESYNDKNDKISKIENNFSNNELSLYNKYMLYLELNILTGSIEISKITDYILSLLLSWYKKRIDVLEEKIASDISLNIEKLIINKKYILQNIEYIMIRSLLYNKNTQILDKINNEIKYTDEILKIQNEKDMDVNYDINNGSKSNDNINIIENKQLCLSMSNIIKEDFITHSWSEFIPLIQKYGLWSSYNILFLCNNNNPNELFKQLISIASQWFRTIENNTFNVNIIDFQYKMEYTILIQEIFFYIYCIILQKPYPINKCKLKNFDKYDLYKLQLFSFTYQDSEDLIINTLQNQYPISLHDNKLSIPCNPTYFDIIFILSSRLTVNIMVELLNYMKLNNQKYLFTLDLLDHYITYFAIRLLNNLHYPKDSILLDKSISCFEVSIEIIKYITSRSNNHIQHNQYYFLAYYILWIMKYNSRENQDMYSIKDLFNCILLLIDKLNCELPTSKLSSLSDISSSPLLLQKDNSLTHILSIKPNRESSPNVNTSKDFTNNINLSVQYLNDQIEYSFIQYISYFKNDDNALNILRCILDCFEIKELDYPSLNDLQISKQICSKLKEKSLFNLCLYIALQVSDLENILNIYSMRLLDNFKAPNIGACNACITGIYSTLNDDFFKFSHLVETIENGIKKKIFTYEDSFYLIINYTNLLYEADSESTIQLIVYILRKCLLQNYMDEIEDIVRKYNSSLKSLDHIYEKILTNLLFGELCESKFEHSYLTDKIEQNIYKDNSISWIYFINFIIPEYLIIIFESYENNNSTFKEVEILKLLNYWYECAIKFDQLQNFPFQNCYSIFKKYKNIYGLVFCYHISLTTPTLCICDELTISNIIENKLKSDIKILNSQISNNINDLYFNISYNYDKGILIINFEDNNSNLKIWESITELLFFIYLYCYNHYSIYEDKYKNQVKNMWSRFYLGILKILFININNIIKRNGNTYFVEILCSLLNLNNSAKLGISINNKLPVKHIKNIKGHNIFPFIIYHFVFIIFGHSNYMKLYEDYFIKFQNYCNFIFPKKDIKKLFASNPISHYVKFIRPILLLLISNMDNTECIFWKSLVFQMANSELFINQCYTDLSSLFHKDLLHIFGLFMDKMRCAEILDISYKNYTKCSYCLQSILIKSQINSNDTDYKISYNGKNTYQSINILSPGINNANVRDILSPNFTNYHQPDYEYNEDEQIYIFFCGDIFHKHCYNTYYTEKHRNSFKNRNSRRNSNNLKDECSHEFYLPLV